jgi:hypothetical protein
MAIKTRATAKTNAKNVKPVKAITKAKLVVKPAVKSVAKPIKKPLPQTKSAVVSGTNKSAKRGDLMKLADEQVNEVIQAQTAQAPQEGQSISGRGVFAVRSLGDAVSVEAAFLVEDGNVLRLPAVFPNREYAMGQIEELRQIVNQHFDAIEASK